MDISSKSNTDIIYLVCRQTNYTYDIAKQKLEELNYNYQEVIKCYMQPTKCTSELSQQPKSVNQRIYFELRKFLNSSDKDISTSCKQDKPFSVQQQKKYNGTKQNKLGVIVEDEDEDEEDEG